MNTRPLLALLLTAWAAAACRSPAPAAAPAPPPDAAPALPACDATTELTPGIPGSPGHPIPSDVNPNGLSELAAHMRMMLADLKAAREVVLKGQAPPPLWLRHRRIRCTWPSEARMRPPGFDDLAQAYLGAVGAMDARDQDPRVGFARVVDACLACHNVTCGGPVPLIEQLKLPVAAAP